MPQFNSRRQIVTVIPINAELAPDSAPKSMKMQSTKTSGSPHMHVDAILSICDHKVTNGIEFSPFVYRLLWLCVLAAHAVIGAVYAEECAIYVQTLGNPRMNSYLQHFGIGDYLRVDVLITMIITSAMVTAWHTAAYLRALLRSLESRGLVFGLLWKALYSVPVGQGALRNQETRVAKLKRSFYLLYAIGGVRSKYFGVAFDIREFIDIASQTYQAYCICYNITDTFIQNVVVALLVFSCWTTLVTRFLLRQNEPIKRLLCLVFDISFDLGFTIAIPFLIYGFWVRIPKANFSDPVLVVTNGATLTQVLVNS